MNAIKLSDQYQSKETRIKNSDRYHQIDTNKQTKLRATFYQICNNIYNEVPKPIQEAEKYCAVVPKLKRYLFDKTLTRSLTI